ncbi:VOC family protein [Pedobacter nototheniae]|uniref:VOC family protein n=1 Tax=Pedobacter nototheniae TaxID=2488994 RepID=UPI002930FEB6|nr:VOC family protein [Pedobacter nototheniae]
MKANHNVLGLHHIAIRAKDFDRTLNFYTQGLGFTVSHSWTLPEFNIKQACMLKSADGDSYIEIFDYQANAPTQGQKANGDEEIKTGSLLHFALNVVDAKLAFNQAIDAGGQECVKPMVLQLGKPAVEVKNALVYSPNGEVIEFLEPNKL